MSGVQFIDGLGIGGAARSLTELSPLLAAAATTSSTAWLGRVSGGVHAQVERAGYAVMVIESGRVREVRRVCALTTAERPGDVHRKFFGAVEFTRLAPAQFVNRVMARRLRADLHGVSPTVRDSVLVHLYVRRQAPHRIRLLRAVATLMQRARRLGDQARQIFDDRFTLERSAQRMVAMYAQVAGERSLI